MRGKTREQKTQVIERSDMRPSKGIKQNTVAAIKANDLEQIEALYNLWQKEKYSAQPSLKLRRTINNGRKIGLAESIPDLIAEIRQLRQSLESATVDDTIPPPAQSAEVS